MEPVTIAQVLSDTNLLNAWYKVRANDGCAGVDGETILDFGARLMTRLALLRDEVIYGTYRPLPLLYIEVPKESGGLRGLAIPAVRDRVLQTAVALVLTPVFEAEFEACSYAYRKGRSVKMAVERVEALRNQGFGWVVDADIRAFFDEIDHTHLLTEVEKLVADPGILSLISVWLRAEVRDDHRRYCLRKGVPQGSPVSPASGQPLSRRARRGHAGPEPSPGTIFRRFPDSLPDEETCGPGHGIYRRSPGNR